MKKLLSLLLILLLFLSSCASASSKAFKNLSLPFNYKLSFGGVPFSAEITPEKAVLTLENVAFSLVFEGDKIKAYCGEYEREVYETDFKVPCLLVKTLREIKNKPSPVNKGLLTFALDESELLVYYNEDSGDLTRLTIKRKGKEFTFDVISALE